MDNTMKKCPLCDHVFETMVEVMAHARREHGQR